MENGAANPLLDLAERYERSPGLRALIQLIPLGLGSAFDSALSTHLSNIRRKRLETFFSAFADGAINLTPEIIESEGFLHIYFATLRAALHTRREEKIRLFGRLLRSAAVMSSWPDSDQLEEFLGIIEDLSYREFRLLTLLDHYSSAPIDMTSSKDDVRRREFLSAANLELGIREEELTSYFARIQRSGLFVPAMFGVDHSLREPGFWMMNTAAFGYGELTPIYHRLVAYLNAAPNLDQGYAQ